MHFLFALMIPWMSSMSSPVYYCQKEDLKLIDYEIDRCMMINDTYWSDSQVVFEKCKKQVLNVFCTFIP